MTIREAVEAALQLIPDDREAENVKIEWREDGTYNLTICSVGKVSMTLTKSGLFMTPYTEIEKQEVKL